MILSSEKYTCDACEYTEYSDCGNPLYSFQRLTYTLMLCKDCLKQYEEEKEEQEKMDAEVLTEEQIQENNDFIRDHW